MKMQNNMLRFPHKAIRARVIKEYLAAQGCEKVVCFSCGNAAERMQEAGLDVLHIGPKGVLAPRKWFTQKEIACEFPGRFDATSGHLPAELMYALSQAYKAHIGHLPQKVYVPTGSGETLVCLKLAYPDTDFVAVYNMDDATEYSPDAPLNAYVAAMAADVLFGMDNLQEVVGHEGSATASG